MTKQTNPTKHTPQFRMMHWLIASTALFIVAQLVQQFMPNGVLAVTIYKAHLMALGGWGGYWLDRALFPYDRPHTHAHKTGHNSAALRRALIVLGTLVCVGMGA